MTNIKFVIGSNFGDEGKGLMADYFCHQSALNNQSCLTVMSNGGSQRGHTVTTPDGTSHVFKHFGSGTFAYADAYCAEDFILNPMEFCREYQELITTGYNPKIYIHYNCRWSTPYDMIVNQIVEEARDNKRHGSCGMGIWETVYRYRQKPCVFSLTEFNVLRQDAKREYLKNIRDSYMINRLKEYGINSIPHNWKSIVYSDNLIENFINDVAFMVSKVKVANNGILRCYQNVVFENGQGLLLDQNQTLYGDNTTPSNTGILNPLKVVSSVFDKAHIEACYVTRTYLTRHGAGRFEEECNKSSINTAMVDETNQTNQFQGHLRYGELVVDDLISRVRQDLQYLNNSKFNWSASFGVTHTNEHQFDYSKLKREFVQNIYLSDRRDRDSVKLFKE